MSKKPEKKQLYKKHIKHTKIRKCKCGSDDADYLLVIDPETNEILSGIKINAKKTSPTRKKNKISKPSLKKGGRKRTLKQKKKKRKTKTKKRRKRNKRKKK